MSSEQFETDARPQSYENPLLKEIERLNAFPPPTPQEDVLLLKDHMGIPVARLTRKEWDETQAGASRIRSARSLIGALQEQYGDNGTVCAVLTLVDGELGGES